MNWRDGVLYQHEQEHPALDSGIDSDDSARELADELLRQQEYFEVIEIDSSEDEPRCLPMGSPKPNRNDGWEWEDPTLKQPGLYNRFIQSLKLRGTRSCEDLELQQDWVRRKIYDDPMKDMEEGRAGLMPMLRRGTSTPESPDRSSPPLYEVELTASDEDEDESVLELVIPLQSAKCNRLYNATLPLYISLFCTIFCCFRTA